VRPGDEITASTHKSRVCVDREDSRGVIHGRRINKDGKPGRKRVLIMAEDVATMRLKLIPDEE